MTLTTVGSLRPRFQWGRRSLEVREEIDPVLQKLADGVLLISPFDVSLTEGGRWDPEAQRAAFRSGASKVDWPNSRHNQRPSKAMHLDPAPVDYSNWLLYYALYGVVLVVAREQGIADQVRWGGDWDRDRQLNEETFRDLAHWELVE